MGGLRVVTPVTTKITMAESRIRSEVGNYASGATKFTVIHRRAIVSIPASSTVDNRTLANSMCLYANHRPKSRVGTKSTSPPVAIEQVSTKKSTTWSRSAERRIKRSLSSDNLDMFAPAPAKYPFPVQIWFNQSKVPRLPVATAYWLDSPLHDSMSFVYTKLLEASQAYRYLQLQSKPRKYLHLTGGGIVAIHPPQGRKAESNLPSMTVKLPPPHKKLPPPHKKLPPPPPLISLRPEFKVLIREQEQPLELCKRRKESGRNSPPQPLDLASSSSVKRKKVSETQQIREEPLDLASSRTLRKSLTEIVSPPDTFRRRLVLVLQVLLGKKKLKSLGHPQVVVDEVLARILKCAGVVPANNVDVRQNWLKFLRLCVKNEQDWKSEGWDRKTPEAILDEIYLQGELFSIFPFLVTFLHFSFRPCYHLHTPDNSTPNASFTNRLI